MNKRRRYKAKRRTYTRYLNMWVRHSDITSRHKALDWYRREFPHTREVFLAR